MSRSGGCGCNDVDPDSPTELITHHIINHTKNKNKLKSDDNLFIKLK